MRPFIDETDADIAQERGEGIAALADKLDEEIARLRAELMPLRIAAFDMRRTDPACAAVLFESLVDLARSIPADRDWYTELAKECRRQRNVVRFPKRRAV